MNFASNKTNTPREQIRILIISPMFDSATKVSHRWIETLINFIKTTPNLNGTALTGFSASHGNALRYLENNAYDIVVYFGHGLNDKWLLGLRSIFSGDQYAKHLGGAIVYTMSCMSLYGFGKIAVDHGAEAYIGSSEPVYGATNYPERDYSEDFARIWFNEIINLLRGFTVRQCVEFAVTEMNETARKYTLLDLKRGKEMAQRLYHNAKFHGFRGNEYAQIPAVVSKDTVDWSYLNERWKL